MRRVQWDHHKVLAEAVPHGECRLFRPHLTNNYPVVRVGDRNYLAHRLVYEGVYGDLPKGSHVHHKCANRYCVNPDHLQRASAAENTLEMIARRDYEAQIHALEARVKQLEAELDIARGAA